MYVDFIALYLYFSVGLGATVNDES